MAIANAGYIGAPATITAGPTVAAAPAVAYSAAPAVSHVSYSSPIVSYGTPAIATPAITTQSQNILRTYGNLGQVSTYSKSIDTPFSSVRKADVRISNPGLKIAAAPLAYSTPAIAHPVAAAPQYLAAPQPAAIGLAYSAAPAVAHVTYSNGYGFNYAY